MADEISQPRRRRLAEIAPRLAAARDEEQAHRMRRISRCWQGGWHADGAGPCFETPEQAMGYRDYCEEFVRVHGRWPRGRAYA